MKLAAQFCSGLLALALAVGAFGQGTFQNLDFESPLLPLVHVDRGFDFVMASNAIPGWTAYIGASQQDSLLYNNYFAGSAAVGFLGPERNQPPSRIDGNYSVTLQAGINLLNSSQIVPAAIAQSSLVPVSALSLQFKARIFTGPSYSQFGVTIGGQNIAMFPLSTTPNYTVYGGDITAFAGLTRELRIAALPTPNFAFFSFALDDIQFSPQAIPEPGAFSLVGLSVLFLGWRLSRRARS